MRAGILTRAASSKDQSGFTLPEVLITIIILGIVLSIGTASWLSLVESRRVDSAANQLAADLRLTHTKAANQLAKWQFAYRFNGSSFACGSMADADYCLLKVNGSTVLEQVPRRLPDDTRIHSTNVDATPPLNLLNYERALEFSANGSMRPLGTLTLSDPWISVGPADGNPPRHTVVVNRATSRVQIDP